MGVKRRVKTERPEPALSERKRVSQATAESLPGVAQPVKP